MNIFIYFFYFLTYIMIAFLNKNINTKARFLFSFFYNKIVILYGFISIL